MDEWVNEWLDWCIDDWREEGEMGSEDLFPFISAENNLLIDKQRAHASKNKHLSQIREMMILKIWFFNLKKVCLLMLENFFFIAASLDLIFT